MNIKSTIIETKKIYVETILTYQPAGPDILLSFRRKYNGVTKWYTTPVRPPADGIVDCKGTIIRVFCIPFNEVYEINLEEIYNIKVDHGGLRNNRQIPEGGYMELRDTCYQKYKNQITLDQFTKAFFSTSTINNTLWIEDVISFLSIFNFEWLPRDFHKSRVNVDSVKYHWKIAIEKHKVAALNDLRAELSNLHHDEDEDIINDINDIITMISSVDIDSEMKDFKSVRDVLTYWPAILLPTPHNIPVVQFIQATHKPDLPV